MASGLEVGDGVLVRWAREWRPGVVVATRKRAPGRGPLGYHVEVGRMVVWRGRRTIRALSRKDAKDAKNGGKARIP